MTSSKAHTSLGSPELHKRHSIMVEGGTYPRSRVMDQTVFDRYLMEGSIDLSQHRSAEFMLNMAARANMWATGAKLDGGFIDSPKKSKVFFGMIPFGNALLKIREDCGLKHHDYTVAVIVHNVDIRKKDSGMKLFCDSMDYVGNNILFFHRNPLRHLR